MAEVSRVLGRMQLDTVGGLVPASGTEGLVGSVERRCSRLVKDDLAAVGASKAGRKMAIARNKAAVGFFTGEIGVTKAELNKEAAGSFPGEIGVTKADLGSKEAAGSFTDEIGVTKASKEAAGSFTDEIGVTKAQRGNKEAGGSITGEIDITKSDEVGYKELIGTGVVTEASWIDFVFPVNPPVGLERKAEPTGAMISKEMVPDSFILKLKKKPVFKRLPPVDDTCAIYSKFPKMRDLTLATMTRWNYFIDLHEDVLRQYAKKGFAEVGVDFTDGVKKIFILPKLPEERCAY